MFGSSSATRIRRPAKRVSSARGVVRVGLLAEHAVGAGLQVGQHAANLGDVLVDPGQTPPAFGGGVVAEGFGLGEDRVERLLQLLHHAAGECGAGGVPLDDEQVEDVQRQRDVAGEDLGKLPVLVVEAADRLALDVEDAHDLAEEVQRHRQRTLGVREAQHVAGVLLDVVTDVAAAGGGDVAGDAVALGPGVEVDLQRLARQALGDHHLQLPAPLVQQADREVVELHQVFAEPDDLFLQQFQPLGGAELRHGLVVDAGQLPARGVDRVDAGLQPLAAGGVPDHRHDTPDRPGAVGFRGIFGAFGRDAQPGGGALVHRRADHLEVAVAVPAR